MTRQLQARLTGALLLLTLAVVFLPMIFTGEGLAPIVPEDAVRIELDDKPKPLATAPDDQVKAEWQFWQRAERLREDADDATQVQDFLVPDEASEAMRGTTSEGKSADLGGTGFGDDGIPLAWAVQVGSFSDMKNAAALKRTLDNHPYLKVEGHGSTLASRKGANSKTVYRVAVGPFLDRRTAEKVRNLLVRDKIAPNAVIRQFSMATAR